MLLLVGVKDNVGGGNNDDTAARATAVFVVDRRQFISYDCKKLMGGGPGVSMRCAECKNCPKC